MRSAAARPAGGDLYRVIVEASRELLALVEPDGRVVYASPSHLRKLGYPAERLVGGSLVSLVHPDDLALVRRAIGESLREGRADRQSFRMRHADGRWLVLEATATAVAATGRNGALVLLTARDVSEEPTTAAQRERGERAEREFVANAAHELRTPITAITAAVDVLQGGAKELPGERDEFLADLERETQRLNRLVHGLLVLAQTQAAHADVRLEPVVLRPLLGEVAAALDCREGVRVSVACPERLAVSAERDLLERALANLALNAAAHTASGEICFAAATRGRRVAVEVRDTGSGITERNLERVFERFYRGGDRDDRGLGLGLAIVREAVRALDGEVELQSQEGRGTTVRILLWPRARS